jgi:hypothetical protein
MGQDRLGSGEPTETPATDAVQRQTEALAAFDAALAALDRYLALATWVNSSQAMMVRAMVGALRGMRASQFGE